MSRRIAIDCKPAKPFKVAMIFFICGLVLRWFVAGTVYLQPNASHSTYVGVWIVLAAALPVVAYGLARTISISAIISFLVGLVALTPVLQLLLWRRLIAESYTYPIFYWPLAVSAFTLFAIAENHRNA